MISHPHASVLTPLVLRTGPTAEEDSSFGAVLLWAALGLILSLVLLDLDPDAMAALQTLS